MKSSIKKAGLFLFLIVGIILAQPPQNRTERAVERLKEKLTLTKEQEKNIKVILDDQQEAMTKEREQHQGDRDAMRAAMIKHRDEADKKIEKLLTKEQKKKYEEYKKERQEMMKNRMRESN
ncbi:MAG: hypothetical protein H3C35_02050 [Bacteroidetes bacterium]|nr:hypothetical protein [Bacteroidota bacterium]